MDKTHKLTKLENSAHNSPLAHDGRMRYLRSGSDACMYARRENVQPSIQQQQRSTEELKVGENDIHEVYAFMISTTTKHREPQIWPLTKH